MAAPLLPAIVLGIDTPIGLTIIRELGRRGVPVIGVANSAAALGLRSRFLQRGLVRATGEGDLIVQLEELIAGPACLFAISEGDIKLLNRHRLRLGRYQLMFADHTRMERVLNKDQTYAAAAKVGIRVPRTAQPGSMAEVRAISAQLKFPVVLKWANPNEVIGVLGRAGLALEKTHYCYAAAELEAYLTPYAQVGCYPLVQEYCSGYGLGQFLLMRDGRAHYTFQHQRLHEWPPEGGVSSLCESLPPAEHAELMGKSASLLRELDWEGVAMVEYRHDPVTGESALMEINGRFWGSLPLAYHAGAPFPWLVYQMFGLQQEVRQQIYLARVRCRFMAPESKRLARILLHPSAIADRTLSFRRLPELAQYFADFFRPRTYYYVFDWRDPSPFFAELWQSLRRRLRRMGPGGADAR